MNPGVLSLAARARRRGFTLLEVLVVLLIIGVLSSLAVLSSGLAARNGPLEEESRRLLALMRFAAEEAVLRTEELALNIDGNGYQFLILVDNAWQPLEDTTLRPRDWPEDLHAELTLEGRDVDLQLPGDADDADEDGEKGDDSKVRPQILILSSGELSPFTLTLTDEARQIRRSLRGSLLGKLELIDPDAEARP